MPTCYLDSQDYSVLTDPHQASPEVQQIKATLIHFARTQQIQFVFSSVVICETVALTPEAAHLGALKADLVAELCGRNALLSMDRLIGTEVNALAVRSVPPLTMVDPNGQWFPNIDFNGNPLLQPTPNGAAQVKR